MTLYTWLKFGHLVGLVLLSGGMATQLIARANRGPVWRLPDAREAQRDQLLVGLEWLAVGRTDPD